MIYLYASIPEGEKENFEILKCPTYEARENEAMLKRKQTKITRDVAPWHVCDGKIVSGRNEITIHVWIGM